MVLRTIFKFLLIAILVSGCSSVLYFPTFHEHVDRAKMPIKPEDIQFQSEDGTSLHGWYFKSLLKPEETSNCTILFFHGNAQNLSTHFFTLYSAPSQGYDYFIFDYRGYGRSEGKPTPAGTVADGRAAIKWLHERDPKRKIVVFGQSLGGIIALKSAIDMKEKAPIQFVVVDSTFSSYKAVGRKVLSRSWITWLFQPLGWLLLGDKEAPERHLDKLPPIPLLVIHGDQDPVIDYSLGERLFERASEPKEFWRVPGGRHTDFMWSAKGEFAKKFYDRLDQACASGS